MALQRDGLNQRFGLAPAAGGDSGGGGGATAEQQRRGGCGSVVCCWGVVEARTLALAALGVGGAVVQARP